jgi:S-adenosylmethionine uptake transporter
MAMGFFTFAASDALAKLLSEHFHPLQIVWMRLIGLVAGVCFILIRRGTAVLKTQKPKLQIARGVIALGSATLFITAVRYVPLADAVAVSFVAPFIVTVLGAAILKEPVGIRRWLAVLTGFIGMIIVIRPGLGVFHPAIFLVVLAAALFAVRQLVSRWLSGIDDIATTVAYTSLVAFFLASFAQPFVWITPSGLYIYLIIFALMLTAGLGELLIIIALDIAQSVVLAPLHYTLIIWGTLYGYFVFGALPDQWTLIGCSIIVISGLYTIYREHRLVQRAAQPSQI